MEAYFRYCYKNKVSGSIDVVDVIVEMVKSGKFYLSPTWCISGQGRGMDLRRFRSLWKTTLLPQETTHEDIELILFPSIVHERERYHTDRQEAATEARMITYTGACPLAAGLDWVDLRTVNTTDTLQDDEANAIDLEGGESDDEQQDEEEEEAAGTESDDWIVYSEVSESEGE
mmetsp:Transcript_42811/g.87502  ORF Transcript_42811/g.87502 Transcript_42811/m.87502 type:complete len:173 (-) Transcript_42811:95-613(-)